MKFSDQLREACKRAGVEWGPTALGKALGVSKQTAERWMDDSQPAADTLFKIADKLKVDARWLATGEMQSPPGLAPLEEQLLQQYRLADPRWQLSVRLLAGLAVEDQIEAATDVNVIVARILGMRPKDLRYPSDADVAAKLGPAPHVRKPLVAVDERNKSRVLDARTSRRARR